jgi:hypothetical protein
VGPDLQLRGLWSVEERNLQGQSVRSKVM